MNIINTEKNKVTAELFDSLGDRVSTIVRDLEDATNGQPLTMPDIFDCAFGLADEYTPPVSCVGDIEDVYFLHYKEADDAYVALDMGDGSEDDYMRGAVLALIFTRVCKEIGYEL